MQAVVKTHPMRVEQEIFGPSRVRYLTLDETDTTDDEVVEIVQSAWYRDILRTINPGENLRVYRELHQMTPEDLGERLGGLQGEFVTQMECGTRPINKVMAMELATLFNVSVEKFLHRQA